MNDDLGDDLAYDDDEDEFGLPSIATMRRKKSRKRVHGTSIDNDIPKANVNTPDTSLHTLPKVNSGDISEERSVPTYPVAKKNQGKILRPQYKEILRGRPRSMASTSTRVNEIG